MTKENMFTNLRVPAEIQKALNLLWGYADDSCLSTWSKEELNKEGYACKGEYGIFVRFILPKNGSTFKKSQLEELLIEVTPENIQEEILVE